MVMFLYRRCPLRVIVILHICWAMGKPYRSAVGRFMEIRDLQDVSVFPAFG